MNILISEEDIVKKLVSECKKTELALTTDLDIPTLAHEFVSKGGYDKKRNFNANKQDFIGFMAVAKAFDRC